MFPNQPFDVPQSFRNALDMATEEQRRRAVQLVADRMMERGYDWRRLALEAGVDPDTVKDFLDRRRWPQSNSRQAIEKALDLPANMIDAVARGMYEPPAAASGDPVEAAIYRSDLTRANQLKLAGIYYEMLEGQESRSTKGA